MSRVVIVGLPGSGKSAVGAAVALRLGVPFIDVDELVAQRQGMTPAEIIRRDGEPAFRQLEQQALEGCIAADVVIATGGGVVVSPACRELLKSQPTVVWLQVSVDSLVTRSRSQDRPLLDGDREQRLTQLANERAAWYEEVSTVSINGEGPLGEVVERLLDAVGA